MILLPINLAKFYNTQKMILTTKKSIYLQRRHKCDFVVFGPKITIQTPQKACDKHFYKLFICAKLMPT